MDAVVEKRRRVLINTAYFALIFAVCIVLFKWFLPLIIPFVLAFVAAAVLNRPVSFISGKTRLKRAWLSVAAVLLLVVLVFTVFFLIGIELFETVSGFYEYSMAQLSNISKLVTDIKLWILDVTVFLPEAVRGTLHENVTVFFDNIIQNGFENISFDMSMINWSEILSKGSEVITGTVGKIPSLFIAAIVFMISTVFISSDYDKIKRFFVKQLKPERAEKISYAWHLGVNSLKKMIKAYCLIILITTFELTVGFYILKFVGVFDSPYVLIIAIAIAIIDIIPVLGTGTVLLPWAVISFIAGNIGMGIGLLVVYVVILVIRQIIEPKLVAGQVGLPPIATIIAMYIGSKTMGVLGFFILPFIVILIKVFNDAGLIHVFNDVHDKPDENPQAAGAADVAVE